jgi:hypothetical protein
MGQVTNVSELRDLSPADWAYEALRSLVERCGCLTGDRSFRGKNTITRREFAAEISICLNRLKQKIQENLVVSKEDLDTIKRLHADFSKEIVVFAVRVDNLDSRVTYLENHLFTPTAKLTGNMAFLLVNVSSEATNPAIFQYRANLNFVGSFTGRDHLLISTFAGNVPLQFKKTGELLDFAPAFKLPGVQVTWRSSYRFPTPLSPRKYINGGRNTCHTTCCKYG